MGNLPLEEKEPGWFERTKLEVKKDDFELEHKKELLFRFDASKALSVASKNYGWKILDDIFNALKIADVFKSSDKSKLVAVLKLLAYQRILNPQSKIATVASQSDLFGRWELNENDVYRSLDKLDELSSDIQLKIHQRITETIGRTATLVFYDVTNYYFETDVDDDFRKRGPSKEHRPKPIVQMGLFMDRKGIPISYQLFRGNQTDPITYLPAIEQVKKQFGIERIIVVADKAMNSKNNVYESLKKGDGWLFSQKHKGLRGAPKEIQAFILERSGWLFNEARTFAQKSMIRSRKLNTKEEVQEKVLVTWNKKYAEREKIRREGALEYASKLTDSELFRQVAKKGGKKYLELYSKDKETGEKLPFSPLIEIDHKQVSFDAQFDGVNVLVTSEINMSDEEMIRQYGQLYKIEDCFRVTKTDFHSRPVYVWTQTHIKAHFLTCFVSLVLLRVLQTAVDWELSSSRLIEALRSATSIEFPQGYEMVQGNEDFQELNKLLKLEWNKQFIEKEKLKKYASGWFTTFF
jgi:transposase